MILPLQLSMAKYTDKLPEPLPLPVLPRKVLDDMRLEEKGKSMRLMFLTIQDLQEELRRSWQGTWGGYYRSPKREREAVEKLEQYMEEGLAGRLEELRIQKAARIAQEEEDAKERNKQKRETDAEKSAIRKERWLNNRGYKTRAPTEEDKSKEAERVRKAEEKMKELDKEKEQEYLDMLLKTRQIEELTEGEKVELQKPTGQFGYDEVGSAIGSEDEEESPFGKQFIRAYPTTD